MFGKVQTGNQIERNPEPTRRTLLIGMPAVMLGMSAFSTKLFAQAEIGFAAIVEYVASAGEAYMKYQDDQKLQKSLSEGFRTLWMLSKMKLQHLRDLISRCSFISALA